MGKLVKISLRDIPVEQRLKAAQMLVLDESGEGAADLLGAALLPSEQTYLVSERALQEIDVKVDRRGTRAA